MLSKISDIRSLEPKTRLPRDNIKVKRFRIEHSPKMSLPHPNLATLGLLPTHIVWTALPLLPWGCVDLHMPQRQNGLVVRWGLSSAADYTGPPSRGLRVGEAVRQWRHLLSSAGPLSLGDSAAVSNPAEEPRCYSVAQGSGLSTGGRLPDSHKPGPDGVGWSGKGPGQASWTAAQCGDCLSAQALGHAATPPWARAPALGFQRDVTGGLAFPLRCRIPTPPTASPMPLPPPKKNSFQSPISPSPQMPLQQLFCFSPEPRLPLTLCHSHHCCLTFGRRRGEVELLHCTHLPHVFPCCGP